MFVKRTPDGRIGAVSRQPEPGFEEEMDADADELRRFFGKASTPLEESDIALVRVLEDLVDLLIEKGVIQFTELPGPAQHKLLQRQSLRQQQQRLQLLAQEETDGDTIHLL